MTPRGGLLTAGAESKVSTRTQWTVPSLFSCCIHRIAEPSDMPITSISGSVGEGFHATHCGATAARPLPALCRLLLEHTGPGLPAGGSEFVPFAINMPTLFRAFVARWLAANLPNKYRLLARYTARLQATGLLDVKVEMVIEYRASGRPSMVLGTNYQNEAGLSADAVQQAAAAAGNVGAAVAVLVYPSAPQNNSQIKALILTHLFTMEFTIY